MTKKAAQYIARKHIEASNEGTLEAFKTYDATTETWKTANMATLADAIRRNTFGYLKYLQHHMDDAIVSRDNKRFEVLQELTVLTNNPEYTTWRTI